MTAISACLERPRQAPVYLKAGLLALGLGLALTAAVLPPARSLSLIVLVMAFCWVLVQPKAAYYLLPVTVPWGSTVAFTLGTTSVTPSDVIVAALVLTWAARHSRVRHSVLTRNPWVVALAILVLIMLISTGQAISYIASLKEIVKWLEVLVVVLLAPTYLRTERDVRTVVLIAIGSGVAEACLAIGQFLLHLGPRSFQVSGGFVRAYGSFGQPNPLAGYLNIILPVAVSAACGWRRKDLGLAALIIAAGSAATLSRAGWAAALLALLVVAWMYSRRFRPWVLTVIAAILVLGLLAAFSVVSTSPFARIASSFGLTGVNFHHYTHANFSEIERAAHWVAGLRMFAAHPLLGVGIGNYPVAYPMYHVDHFLQPLGHAHDYFINIAAEAGILGLLAYAFFLCAAFWYSTRAASSQWPMAKVLGIGVLGAWVSSTFHNLFDVLYVHEIPTLLGVLMAVLAVAIHRDKEIGVRRGRATIRRRNDSALLGYGMSRDGRHYPGSVLEDSLLS